MDGSAGAPGTPGGSEAQPTTAALLAALVLPEGSESALGAHQPYPPHPGYPERRRGSGVLNPDFEAGVAAADEWLSAEEAIYNGSVDALIQWGRLEARVAAGKAREIERLDAASDRISRGLGLDWWQRQEAAASTAAELAAALCVPEAAANGLLSESFILVHERPRTLQALAAGDLSYRHAEVILDEVGSLTAAAEPGIPACVAAEFESRLLALAPGLTVPKFKAKARKWREREHPETMVSRHKAAVTQRRLQLTPDRDGMSYLSAYLPAPTAQGIWNRATRAARSAQGPEEPRTLTQLRVDIAAGWMLNGQGSPAGPIAADGTAADGSAVGSAADEAENDDLDDANSGTGSPDGCPSPQAQILVTIPVFALMGLTDEPAELEGYGPIPPDLARKLAAECPEIIRLLIHPHTGEPLAIGRDRYRVSKRLRTWLRARDQTCTFTGCNTVTADTQLDHITGWEHGSGTSEDELTDECKKHHLIKHFKDGKDCHGKRKGKFATCDGTSADGETCVGDPPGQRMRGWTPSMTNTGQTAWTSPAGRFYPPPPPDHHPPRLPELMAHSTQSWDVAPPGTAPPWDPCNDAGYRALFLVDCEVPGDPEGRGPVVEGRY
ncbi:HNH endonuclease signature motif containing protein [Paenarthrobacter sp. PH39-S1]|uniref:HNH endonuclease signature motif containing protein n=1 Tax=Paenarthrobacter sp. PH39-S1 TaxID=3046204 RepID=UPI0024B9B906|nr:HNH endonuclease signature motif containing protein [Paenarthrobacter sp. PH39-S1]MDJ0358381.1 DUF222 domain-containing protein [Paenarthrobacter sp. PH39-S1]